MLIAAIANPPSAGPIARLTLKLVLLMAIALSRSPLGTSIGVISSQAGAAIAPPTPSRKVVARRTVGVAQCKRNNGRERDGNDHHGELSADQQSARIHEIGKRPGREGQQEQRQPSGDLDRRHHHRVRIEAGHQPAHRRVEHADADVRHGARDQNDGEREVAENAPARRHVRGRVRFDAGLAGQIGLRPHIKRLEAPRAPADVRWPSTLSLSRRLATRAKSRRDRVPARLAKSAVPPLYWPRRPFRSRDRLVNAHVRQPDTPRPSSRSDCSQSRLSQ